MLRQNIQVVEHLFAIFFILQTLLPSYFGTSITFFCFASLIVAKYLFEGFRTTILIIFFIQFILLFTRSVFVGLPLSALMYATLIYFPIYHYPEPMGKYKVGYKRLVMPGITNIGVYYPTTEKTEDVRHLPYDQAWSRIAVFWNFFAEYFKTPQIPEILFKISFNALQYQGLGVNKDAKIATEAADKFPVVLFSHGLSANIHLYSLNLKEWASNGFIAFSVDHDEQLRFPPHQFVDYPGLLKLRGAQLEDRKAIIKKVLDLISKPENVHGLFENDQVNLDYDNVFAAGHSFGGATAAEAAIEDSRITGGLLILDPWFEPAHFDILYKPINKPFLSIRSSQYDKEGTGELSRKHAKVHCNENGLGLSGYFQESLHNSCADLQVLLPRELTLFEVMKRMDDIEENIKYNTGLARGFLQAALEYNRSNVKDGVNLKAQVLKNFRSEMKELGVPDVLVVDE